jgi:hypothetical protein
MRPVWPLELTLATVVNNGYNSSTATVGFELRCHQTDKISLQSAITFFNNVFTSHLLTRKQTVSASKLSDELIQLPPGRPTPDTTSLNLNTVAEGVYLEVAQFEGSL